MTPLTFDLILWPAAGAALAAAFCAASWLIEHDRAEFPVAFGAFLRAWPRRLRLRIALRGTRHSGRHTARMEASA